MKTKIAVSVLWIIALVACIAAFLTGCSINNPKFVREIHHTNGVVEIERMSVPSIAAWPATVDLAKQRASLGKTFTLGTDGLREETGSTNVSETIREMRLFIQSLR